MDTVKYITAPVEVGPLTLSVVVTEGTPSRWSVYLAGRPWVVEKLTHEERAWLRGQLAKYGWAL